MKNKSADKFPILFRILELLLAHGELRAGQLLSILKSENFFNPEADDKTVRRLLNYYLSQLEGWGFIKRVNQGRALRWRLAKKIFHDNCYLSPLQKALLAIVLLLAEEVALEPLKGEIENLLRRLSFEESITDHLSRDSAFRYFYGLDFSKLLPTVARILEAIERRRFISLLFKGEKVYRKLLPIGLAIRNGKLYMVALEEQGEKRFFSIDRISTVTLLDGGYAGKNFPRPPAYVTFKEKPFIFSMEIRKNLYMPAELMLFHPLVFHSEEEEGVRRVYVVGFAGEYFASRFCTFVFDRLLPPDARAIELARSKNLKLRFPDLALEDLETLKGLYGEFLKALEKVLELRLSRVREALG